MLVLVCLWFCFDFFSLEQNNTEHPADKMETTREKPAAGMMQQQTQLSSSDSLHLRRPAKPQDLVTPSPFTPLVSDTSTSTTKITVPTIHPKNVAKPKAKSKSKSRSPLHSKRPATNPKRSPGHSRAKVERKRYDMPSNHGRKSRC